MKVTVVSVVDVPDGFALRSDDDLLDDVSRALRWDGPGRWDTAFVSASRGVTKAAREAGAEVDETPVAKAYQVGPGPLHFCRSHTCLHSESGDVWIRDRGRDRRGAVRPYAWSGDGEVVYTRKLKGKIALDYERIA